jgi:hypothetical protein
MAPAGDKLPTLTAIGIGSGFAERKDGVCGQKVPRRMLRGRSSSSGEKLRELSSAGHQRICYSLTMPWSQKFLGGAVQFSDGAVLVAAELSELGVGQNFELLLRAAHSAAIMEAKRQLLQALKAEGLI